MMYLDMSHAVVRLRDKPERLVDHKMSLHISGHVYEFVMCHCVQAEFDHLI